ncbi:MAG: hypothetical protein GY768_08065 [Planctomycetaceae bacterium]|nr:hypothetical protein [Planctomycetaceae bacterium]
MKNVVNLAFHMSPEVAKVTAMSAASRFNPATTVVARVATGWGITHPFTPINATASTARATRKFGAQQRKKKSTDTATTSSDATAAASRKSTW